MLLILQSCHQNSENHDCNNMINVKITDKYLIDILTTYTDHFNFNGKGIPIVTINNFNADTTKYYIGIVFRKSEILSFFPQRSYFLYDTINQRLVIINSKLENFILFPNSKCESDTILNKYFFEENGPPTLIESYTLQYDRVDSGLTRKVIYKFPY